MKKLSHIIGLAIFVFTQTSCLKQDLTKDFSDYDPIVKMDSVSYPGDGTAGFYGHIERIGSADIEALGFYYGNEAFVNELSNQILVQPTNKNFVTWVDDLIPDSTYTVGCFAANRYGSSTSIISTKVPFPEPITAPCTIAEGTLNFFGSNSSTRSEYANFRNSGYEIEATSTTNSGLIQLAIMFVDKPVNGKYTINSFQYNQNNKKAILMKVLFGGQYYFFKDGDVVYIEQLKTGLNHYRVTFCNSSFTFGSSTTIVCKAHFVTQ
jgi:hypothetical protein